MSKIRINSRYDLDVCTQRPVKRDKSAVHQLDEVLARVPRGWQVERVHATRARVSSGSVTLTLRAPSYFEATVTYRDEFTLTRRARDLPSAVRVVLAHAAARASLTSVYRLRALKKSIAI